MDRPLHDTVHRKWTILFLPICRLIVIPVDFVKAFGRGFAVAATHQTHRKRAGNRRTLVVQTIYNDEITASTSIRRCRLQIASISRSGGYAGGPFKYSPSRAGRFVD